MNLYVGTYTKPEDHVNGHAEGIAVYRFDGKEGTLIHCSTAVGIVNPSYLALHPRKPVLYAVSERNDYEGRETGAVYAFSLNHSAGELELLNSAGSMGTMPCHLSLDREGEMLFAANYISGSFSVFGVKEDGSLTGPLSWIQREGTSINPHRQEGPHTHAVVFDSENRHLFVPDLGTDTLAVYTVGSDGRINPADTSIPVEPGSGPRHFTFHPDWNRAYLVNELSSTIVVMDYIRSEGRLEPVQTILTLPEGWDGESYAAAVKIHPGGKYLYTSNRGHDSVAVFAVDGEDGTLSSIGWEPTRGNTPRDIALSPGGGYILAANQDTDTIQIFRIDPGTGMPACSGTCNTASPVCLLFDLHSYSM